MEADDEVVEVGDATSQGGPDRLKRGSPPAGEAEPPTPSGSQRPSSTRTAVRPLVVIVATLVALFVGAMLLLFVVFFLTTVVDCGNGNCL